MKTIFLFATFVFFTISSVFCNGYKEFHEPKRIQEIELGNITKINISCISEKVSIFRVKTTDLLVIEEYMRKQEDNNDYYAYINKSEDTITIEKFGHPRKPIINPLQHELEVYIPLSYVGAISIKTENGEINLQDIYGDAYFSNINIENISGGVLLTGTTTENANIKTFSGNITIYDVNGIITIETSNSDIELMAGEKIGNITINTIKGDVKSLELPSSLGFNFYAKTTRGRLTTPFSDRLSVLAIDGDMVQGYINGNNVYENIPTINIVTDSGSIKVNWRN